MKVEALHQDKQFMEKSMEAIKTRNETLEPLVQSLQVSHQSSCTESMIRQPQSKIATKHFQRGVNVQSILCTSRNSL